MAVPMMGGTSSVDVALTFYFGHSLFVKCTVCAQTT